MGKVHYFVERIFHIQAPYQSRVRIKCIKTRLKLLRKFVASAFFLQRRRIQSAEVLDLSADYGTGELSAKEIKL